MKQIIWENPNKMHMDSGFKLFDKQTNLISTGNVFATTQRSVFIAPWREKARNDKELNMADVVGVRKRYQDNCRYGNKITLDNEVVYSIVEENYQEELIYWEVDRVNGELCRQHEVVAYDITEVELYVEFENYSDTIMIEINPFEEIVRVK